MDRRTLIRRSRQLDEVEQQLDEEEWVLDGLTWKLARVYGGSFGEFRKWNAETAAQRTAEFLADGRLDWWNPFVHRSRHSPFAGRVLELLGAQVLGRMRFEAIFGSDRGREMWANLSWPGSEKLELSQLADWIEEKVAAKENKLRKPLTRGRDPGRLVWRNVCVAQTVGEIVRVGLRSATYNGPRDSACRLVGEHLGLSYDTALKLWMKRRKLERARERPRQ